MAKLPPLPKCPRWDGPLSHPFYSNVVKRALDFTLALLMLIPASFGGGRRQDRRLHCQG